MRSLVGAEHTKTHRTLPKGHLYGSTIPNEKQQQNRKWSFENTVDANMHVRGIVLGQAQHKYAKHCR